MVGGAGGPAGAGRARAFPSRSWGTRRKSRSWAAGRKGGRIFLGARGGGGGAPKKKKSPRPPFVKGGAQGKEWWPSTAWQNNNAPKYNLGTRKAGERREHVVGDSRGCTGERYGGEKKGKGEGRKTQGGGRGHFYGPIHTMSRVTRVAAGCTGERYGGRRGGARKRMVAGHSLAK